MITDKCFRIARRPWWMRRRVACPSCGWVVRDADADLMAGIGQTFTCERCGIQMSAVDFWTSHEDKISDKADLSGEESDQ